jgi:hypothetical protein
VVGNVGGVTAANVATGAGLANTATNVNTVSTIVKRDASGNFAAGTVTANLTGNVIGNLNGNVTGNVSGTSANVTGTVAVANGGTGATTLAANNVLLGNGTSAPLAVAPGASGNVLMSNGTTWTSSTPTTNWAAPGAIGATTPSSAAFTTLIASGNVGIGTTAPSNALEVAGSIKSTSGGYKFPDGTTQTTSAGITGCPSGMTMVPADPSNGFVAYCIDSSNTTGVGANDAQIACQNAGKHLCRAQELYRASAAIAVSCATAIWNGDGLTFWNGAHNFANYTSGASCNSNGWAPMSNTYPYRCCR